MRKVLVDDLNRIVGVIEVDRGEHGNVEYGITDSTGAKYVRGIARMENPSDIGLTKEDVEQLTLWK